MALYAFDYDDGVIYHQANGQHQPEHRKRIDRETDQREDNKRTHKRNRHGQQWDERRAPVLQEEVDDKDHQSDGDQKGYNDLLQALCHGARLVKRYNVIHIAGEALLHLRHQLADTCRRLNRIGSGQLVNGDNRGRFAIQAADNAVILRAQFNPGDVFHSDDAAVRSFTDDDVFKFLRRRETALSENGISELLVRGSWFAAYLASRPRLSPFTSCRAPMRCKRRQAFAS